MICDRCGELIERGDPVERRDIPGESLGGATVVMHGVLCRRPTTQTYPAQQ